MGQGAATNHLPLFRVLVLIANRLLRVRVQLAQYNPEQERYPTASNEYSLYQLRVARLCDLLSMLRQQTREARTRRGGSRKQSTPRSYGRREKRARSSRLRRWAQLRVLRRRLYRQIWIPSSMHLGELLRSLVQHVECRGPGKLRCLPA